MKKLLYFIVVISMLLLTISFYGCQKEEDDFYDVEQDFKYAVVYETKEYFAHEIESFELIKNTDLIILHTKCCEKTIMTDMARVIMFNDLISYSTVSNIVWCGGGGLHS